MRLTAEHHHDSGAEPTDTFDLVLTFDGGRFGVHDQLAVICVSRLRPVDPERVGLVERVGSRTILTPTGDGLAPHRWVVPPLGSEFPPRHANDGPTHAYVVHADGTTTTVEVVPATTRSPVHATGAGDERRSDDPERPASVRSVAGVEPSSPASRDSGESPVSSGAGPTSSARVEVAGPGRGSRESVVGRSRGNRPQDVLLPAPFRIVSFGGGGVSTTAHLAPTGSRHREIWTSVGQLVTRLTGDRTFDEREGDDPGVSGLAVSIVDDASIPAHGYRLRVGADRVTLTAADPPGVRHGLISLAQWLRSEPEQMEVEDRPAHERRIVHLDLARSWFEPEVVLRLIDLAAWRKLSHVHLHLTDDEAWRLPVADLPQLAERGGRRGHGLPIGPLCGSGAEPYGRAYTEDEIATFVRRAGQLGVVLVPEIDVPGHCHAALAAYPELRDPDDRSEAVSIQGFRNNVLVPGHPLTDEFVDTVFGAVAHLFPDAVHLHIGGDEVPNGSWLGSPLARRFAALHGVPPNGLFTAFARRIVERVRAATGRRIAAWEEVAFAGAMTPDDGYVVAWTSPDAAAALVARGFEVVAAPGQAYYLDMAVSSDWHEPGASWAGHVDLATTCDFDPGPAWRGDAPSGGRLVGVQACQWTEHLATPALLDRLTFPRLDAVAERGWTGEIADGPDSLTVRARRQPSYTSPGG